MALTLEDLHLYGAFLAIDTATGEMKQDTGRGLVVAIGFEVQNYAVGPALKLGDEVIFRSGTSIKPGGETSVEVKGAETLVFVSLSDVMAIVKTPAEPPVGEAKPA